MLNNKRIYYLKFINLNLIYNKYVLAIWDEVQERYIFFSYLEKNEIRLFFSLLNLLYLNHIKSLRNNINNQLGKKFHIQERACKQEKKHARFSAMNRSFIIRSVSIQSALKALVSSKRAPQSVYGKR